MEDAITAVGEVKSAFEAILEVCRHASLLRYDVALSIACGLLCERCPPPPAARQKCETEEEKKSATQLVGMKLEELTAAVEVLEDELMEDH